MPPVPSKTPIELKRSQKPSQVTPENMKQNMEDVGLNCEDTSPERLQVSIDEVRSTLRRGPLEAFMIAGQTSSVAAQAEQLGTSARQVLSEQLEPGAHDLVDVLADANPKVQNLVRILGSRKAGTRGFVEELMAHDRTGHELFKTINAPDKSARDFVEQLVAHSHRGGRPTEWVAGYNSPAVSMLARFAELDQEPVATSTWTPDPTGGITGPYMTMLGTIQYEKNFEKIRERYKEADQPFPGVTTDFDPGTKQMKTNDAIVDFFKLTCQGVVTTVAQQVDQGDLEALITTYIEPVTSQNDYVMEKDRFIYLAQDYDPEQQLAFGVGIVTLHYKLTVQNYLRKSKHGGDTHNVNLPMHARGIEYPGAVGFSNICLDNRYVTGKCESCCAEAKTWYEQNPKYGTWPASNTQCPPTG